MREITKRQKDLLDFIINHIRENNWPPTVSEMAKGIGVKSKNAVAKLLKELEDKEYIERDTTARGIKVLDSLGVSLQKGMVSAPLVGEVSAGSPILAEENIEDWISLPVSITAGKKDIFLLRVRGDSMIEAGIFEDDLVVVKQSKEVEHNDIVVALIGDDATVKRLIKKNGNVYLKPENSKYSNIYPQEEWTIQGKVIGVIRTVN